MDESAKPTQIEGRERMSFLAKYKFTIISLCIILIALIPLIIISKNTKTPPTASTNIAVSPTQTPLTKDNAEPTVSAIDNQIQSAIDKSTQDTTQVTQIDTTQDSTVGL